MAGRLGRCSNQLGPDKGGNEQVDRDEGTGVDLRHHVDCP